MPRPLLLAFLSFPFLSIFFFFFLNAVTANARGVFFVLVREKGEASVRLGGCAGGGLRSTRVHGWWGKKTTKHALRLLFFFLHEINRCFVGFEQINSTEASDPQFSYTAVWTFMVEKLAIDGLCTSRCTSWGSCFDTILTSGLMLWYDFFCLQYTAVPCRYCLCVPVIGVRLSHGRNFSIAGGLDVLLVFTYDGNQRWLLSALHLTYCIWWYIKAMFSIFGGRIWVK